MRKYAYLCALALAALTFSANTLAYTFNFETAGNIYDTSTMKMYPLVQDKNILLAVPSNDFSVAYTLTSLNPDNRSDVSDESLTGALIGAGRSSCEDQFLQCPANASNYYAALNAPMTAFSSFDLSTNSFNGTLISSFDAAFIGAPGSINSQASGVPAGELEVIGITLAGDRVKVGTYSLNGTDAGGALSFQNFVIAPQYQQIPFKFVTFNIYNCEEDGPKCTHAASLGNFAIDNVVLTSVPVPEPSRWLLALAGLAAVAGVTRRRRAA